MRKLLIGFLTITILSLFAIDLKGDCSGINWEEHCNPTIDPDDRCKVGNCSFVAMVSKEIEVEEPDLP
jgi:hypothetical protein